MIAVCIAALILIVNFSALAYAAGVARGLSIRREEDEQKEPFAFERRDSRIPEPSRN